MKSEWTDDCHWSCTCGQVTNFVCAFSFVCFSGVCVVLLRVACCRLLLRPNQQIGEGRKGRKKVCHQLTTTARSSVHTSTTGHTFFVQLPECQTTQQQQEKQPAATFRPSAARTGCLEDSSMRKTASSGTRLRSTRCGSPPRTSPLQLRSAQRLVGWLVGRLVGWFVGWFAVHYLFVNSACVFVFGRMHHFRSVCVCWFIHLRGG